MNVYELSRTWFDFCFENPEKISPNHSALYFFCIEHCNRLGWKERFGLPTTMAKEAIGIRSYNTYIKTLNDLVEFGFIKMVEKSKNQYSSNIIALSKFNKALNKALDKAFIKHVTKQCESTQQSIDSIDKPIYNNTNLQINNITESYFSEFENGNQIHEMARIQKTTIDNLKSKLKEFRTVASTEYVSYGKFIDHFRNWFLKNKEVKSIQTGSSIILGKRK
ncbi:hypothetical protein UFOVP87_41 [uncultured Caudovirales phage]|uniref:Uncharacterized protein n=1 Tax=uncultured Caudovirales phage TaxID=2100421 RepID=A0A6J5L0C5_9CAUD|nr:hypothetical protein UFOVP87_41 [uncultured Caudovirales phage]